VHSRLIWRTFLPPGAADRGAHIWGDLRARTRAAAAISHRAYSAISSISVATGLDFGSSGL
jgi:hypothetical protein